MYENRNRYIIFTWISEGRRRFERPNVDGNIEVDVK